MKPLASVIIPVLNEDQNLLKCLSAVFGQEVDFNFEVLVVDSGSTDRTRELAQEFAQKQPLRLLEVKREEFSHGRTRQFASEQAQGEYLIYLVADAVPADNQWLKKLVDSARNDDKIAGVYSRQLPRPGAELLEKIRLKRRKVSSAEPSETEIKKAEDYWLMTPLLRIGFCDFDDVSSLRKKSALDKIPIRDCAWAEDLVWSRDCLLKGFKIVYQPESMVYHSHPGKAFYFFRRGWLDQKSAGKYFGQVYYPALPDAVRGFFYSIQEMLRDAGNEEAEFFEKLSAIFQAPIISAFEIAGRYLAGLKQESEAGYDLVRNFSRATILPANARERVTRTAFTIGDGWKKVILANPAAIINYQVQVREDSELRFGIGIKPEAFRNRSAPIDFMVALDQEPIFKTRLEMTLENLQGWKEFALPLKQWAGKEVKLSLVTASEDIKSGWAGWAEPKIVFKDKKPGRSLKKYLAGWAEQRAGSSGFRHP